MRIAGIVVVLALAGVSEVHACSCPQVSRAETVARADLIVRGTVAAVETVGRVRRATLRVTLVEKGPRLSTVQIETPSFGPACGVPFRVGQRVTVAARRRGAVYSTNSCLQFGLGRR